MINAQFVTTETPSERVLPTKNDVTELYKDISLEPYGCFSLLDEKFFSKQINRFSKDNVFDSGITISETNANHDTSELIKEIIKNGFDKYGYHLIHKYNNDYKNMNIVELGVLGKLAGYNYLSIYKLDKHTRGNIYYTYSPPLDKQLDFNATKEMYKNNLAKSDLPKHTLTPKLNNYTNEEEKAPGKEMSCGYPCLSGDKPVTFDHAGSKKQYMCGSVGFPNIKIPTRFAVYRIVEK